MIGKRIGKWSWALSPEERVTAASAERATREGTPAGVRLQRRYELMVEKQRKLTAREGPAKAGQRGGAGERWRGSF